MYIVGGIRAVGAMLECTMPDASDTAATTVARLFAARARASSERSHERRSRALASLPRLVAALVARGAHRVWLFGSLAWGTPHEASDIDLAVEGLPRDDLFHAMGELLAVAPVSVDLVRIEEAPPGLVRRVRIEGRLIHG
jgi:predicted nucleotidyltransferase